MLRSQAAEFFDGARFSWSAFRAPFCATFSDLCHVNAATASIGNAGLRCGRVHADRARYGRCTSPASALAASRA